MSHDIGHYIAGISHDTNIPHVCVCVWGGSIGGYYSNTLHDAARVSVYRATGATIQILIDLGKYAIIHRAHWITFSFKYAHVVHAMLLTSIP